MSVSRTEEDLKKLLKEQISFLKSSCKSFDKGFYGEAKRIATTIRILIHDTSQSVSLLGQLRLKNNDFYSSASEFNPLSLLTHSGLVAMRIEAVNGSSDYVPFLDDLLPGSEHFCNFNKWWSEEIIIKDKNGNLFTRKDIILFASNKDGGAHIDPNLNQKFDDLINHNSVNWYLTTSGYSQPFGSESNQLVMASIRQIGFEILKTLDSMSY